MMQSYRALILAAWISVNNGYMYAGLAIQLLPGFPGFMRLKKS